MKNNSKSQLARFLSNNSLLFPFLYFYRLILLLLKTSSRLNIRDSYRILKYKNKYKGKRCFIIGNGPSLNNTQLELLKNEYTFGLNRIYLNFQKMGYKTSFLVVINKLVLEQCSIEISPLGITTFLSSEAKTTYKNNPNILFLKTIQGTPLFSDDPINGFYEGATVTYVALQLAYYMGFAEVFLVGVDHNFVTKGTPHKIVDQKTPDLNHFSGKYFKNMKWQLPDLITSTLSYQLAKLYYEYSGRKIFDATVNGKLKVFEKTSLKKIFS